MSEPTFDEHQMNMLHRVGGEKLVGKMGSLFAVNAPLRLQGVEDALNSGDTSAGANCAHSLKSSAGQLGAVGLQRLCDELESDCVAGNLENARKLLRSAREELPTAIAWIQNWKPDQ